MADPSLSASTASDLGIDETEEFIDVDDSGDVGGSVGSHKKHKKHKKHKHKKKKDKATYEVETDFSAEHSTPTAVQGPKPQLKLKIKLAGKTLGTKSVAVPKVEIPEPSSEEEIQVSEDDGQMASLAAGSNPPTDPEKTADTEDEEEAWLEALEAGKLDEYGEIRKEKDPALLTARQRALLKRTHPHQPVSEPLLMLPSGYKEKELTEEMLQRRALKAKKRRQLAHEKREKDKKQTIERLLKKQDAKAKGARGKGFKKLEVPLLTYINNQTGCSISLPVGVEFPLPAQGPLPPLKPKEQCGVAGCCNPKKYACSKTGVPLCSLECYKKNLSRPPRAARMTLVFPGHLGVAAFQEDRILLRRVHQ